HDAATPLPGALARAAEEALGPESSVSVRALAREAPRDARRDPGSGAHAPAGAGQRWGGARRGGARGGGGDSRALTRPATSPGAAAAGVVAYVIPPAEERRLALGLRADALLLYESLSHLSADDTAPARGVRLLPGAAARVEGQLAISATLALFLAGGAEIAFGR